MNFSVTSIQFRKGITKLLSFLVLIGDSVPIRIVGNNEWEGRVEVYHNGRWGTVCDDSWDDNDATVVCRQLGLGESGTAVCCAGFGQGEDPIWLDNVRCTGSESNIGSCGNNGWGIEDCGHGEDAGVRCSTDVSSVLDYTTSSPDDTTVVFAETSSDTTNWKLYLLLGLVPACVITVISLGVIVLVVRGKRTNKDMSRKENSPHPVSEASVQKENTYSTQLNYYYFSKRRGQESFPVDVIHTKSPETAKSAGVREGGVDSIYHNVLKTKANVNTGINHTNQDYERVIIVSA